MQRSGAIWLVVGVVAVAAALMYFVVLPQIRDGRAVEDIARQAGDAVTGVQQAVNDAARQVEDVADGAEEARASELAKMSRLGEEARRAADQLEAVLTKTSPDAEEVAAAKAKLATALKAAADLKPAAKSDEAVATAAARVTDGARAALAALEALPADPAAAKAALSDLEARLAATLPHVDALDPPAATPDSAQENASAPADQAAANAAADLPAFDILRVEKDGSTVIAGRARPGQKVEIVDGGKVIASTKADPSGDFAAVLDDPLAPGDHSITLRATTDGAQSTTSQEVATVSVPKDGSGELLAMVTKPGQASKIIAMPGADNADLAGGKNTTPGAADEAARENAARVATSEADADAVPDAAKSEEAAAQQTAKLDVTEAQPELSAGTQQAPAAGDPEVLVSAVELEGDRIFVAGNTRPGAMVRIYADDRVVAEARADNAGRFVADGTIRLAVGNHTIRADVLSSDGARVVFRASVPFYRPEGDLAAIASSQMDDRAFEKARIEAGKALALLKNLYADGASPTSEELAAARSSAEIALKSLSEVNVPANADPRAARMTKATADARKALDTLKAVPANVVAMKSALNDVEAIVGSVVRPDPEVASADDADRSAVPSRQARQDDEAGAVDKSGDPVSSDDIQVTAKVDRLEGSNADGVGTATDDASAGEQAASADQPKVILQAPLTQSDGSVIIRRGDTLWQISRRVYGRGVRYTTIYMANQTQIENPDRIKPGQIFSMPGKWLDNAEELHKERLQHRSP